MPSLEDSAKMKFVLCLLEALIHLGETREQRHHLNTVG